MKPLDFGADGVTGSVNADGRIIALNFYHPQHGYVTLTSAEPFPENARYNPALVRAYRAGLPRLDGFGIGFDAPARARNATLRASALPVIALEVDGDTATVTTFACAQGAVQFVNAAQRLVPRWQGKLCLQRCAYTELTEGGPLPMPPLRMNVFCRDGLLIIHNPELGAAVAVAGLSASCEARTAEQPIELDFALAAEGRATLAYGIGLSVESAAENARWLHERASLEEAAARWEAVWGGLPDDPLARRGIAYGLMTAIPAGAGNCLLTDHMLLPLSWNRDAYFVARALLSAGQREVVRRHLLWTFETAERPDGAWARCYTANGRVKDPAFQLDQQFYPLLELAEYVLETGDQETAARLRPHIEAVMAMLDARRAGRALLFPTEESPADDPIPLPYHLSSHILIWRTLTRLEAMGAAGSWSGRTAPLQDAILQTFVAEHNGGRIFAYATDGAGHFHFYHDANDFPLALAPAWGFIPAQDSVWKATIDFAFSDANRGGVYGGRLGSVHTPAPWSLGDVQELIVARLLKDAPREQRARAHLRAAAQADGALPEAYDGETGAVVSRHWFAWPNAALACAELGAFSV